MPAMALDDPATADFRDTSVPLEYLVAPFLRPPLSGYVHKIHSLAMVHDMQPDMHTRDSHMPEKVVPRSMAETDPAEATRARRRVSLEREKRARTQCLQASAEVVARRNLQIQSEKARFASRLEGHVSASKYSSWPGTIISDETMRIARLWRLHVRPPRVSSCDDTNRTVNSSLDGIHIFNVQNSTCSSQNRARLDAAKEYSRKIATELRASRAKRTVVVAPKKKHQRGLARLAFIHLDGHSSHSSESVHARAQLTRIISSAPAQQYVVGAASLPSTPPESRSLHRGSDDAKSLECCVLPISHPATFVSPGPNPLDPFVRA